MSKRYHPYANSARRPQGCRRPPVDGGPEDQTVSPCGLPVHALRRHGARCNDQQDPVGSTSNLNLQFRVTPSDGYYVAEVAHSKRYSDEFVIDLISEYEKDLKALAKKVLDD